ncbi:Oidioi.mRNA.OKI2018_I69.chr1.g586.t1.cds [Oikopleura dioica]|uniref:Oidioi.mRNA.OKI2018_I69.chr1.g586.t1.cds n=1 Tax=Oikopleura dioica TaxID=34765 RepID=A0ABN7SKC2_OIKDI|nr:Oidioi.mRNA.OKI2018_I69.chr1.g586.t1.cds [Oikopleura dioica]
MRLSSAIFASVYAGYYQQYNSLTSEEREDRRVICDAKIEETKAAFPIANGSWNCPGLGLTRSKVKCHPTCESGFKPDWTTKPKKDGPRFLTRCGDPATVARKNLPTGTQLSCSPVDIHPCKALAAATNIEDGQLKLYETINQKRADYSLVCEDGTVNGRVRCVEGEFKAPFWNKTSWETSCVGKTTTTTTTTTTTSTTTTTTEAAPSCTNPCDGLNYCTTLVDGCAINPFRNNYLGALDATLSYRIGVDVLCDSSTTGLDDKLRNIVQMGQFVISRQPDKNTYEISHKDHNGSGHYFNSVTFDCIEGEWNSFEAVQTDNMDGFVSYSVKIDGVEVLSGTYESMYAQVSGSFRAYASDPFAYPALSYKVKNFFYQKWYS